MQFEELELNKQQRNVSNEPRDYMLNMIRKNKLKKVLEIGCFNGYSAIYFSTMAENVKTIEIYPTYAGEARKNLDKFNIKNVEIIEGDAKEVLKNLNEKFDFIFIDAMKKEYGEYLKLSLKLIDKGFIYADNTISHKEDMREFFDYLKNSKLKWKELGMGKGLVEIRVG